MCIISGCVTKDFGVIASDSAMYDNGKVSFNLPKMNFVNGNLLTFIGMPLFFMNLDKFKIGSCFLASVIYLKDHFRSMEKQVGEILTKVNSNPDDQKPVLCAFLMGVHDKRPVLAQFNSFQGFEPTYLYSDNGPKFSTIFYGDDKPDKKKMFIDSTSFMEEKLKDFSDKGIEATPWVLGEILTRGIYSKADAEEKMEPRKKYAGGIVTVASIHSDGKAYCLSDVRL